MVAIREYSKATCFLISCMPLLLYVRNVLLLEIEKIHFFRNISSSECTLSKIVSYENGPNFS